MDINNDQQVPAVALSNQFFMQERPQTSFTSMLDAERVKAEVEGARNEILGDQKSPKKDLNKDDIEFIREHGMRAYVEEVHKQKIEELREKLLAAMGLSEEALAELPADQRLAIEKMIAEEIQKRTAADSMTNGDSGQQGKGQGRGQGPAAVANIGPENLLAAQVVSGDPGTIVGLAISEAGEGPEPSGARAEKDVNG